MPRAAWTFGASLLTSRLILPLPGAKYQHRERAGRTRKACTVSKYELKGDEPLLHSLRLRVTASDREHINKHAEAAGLTVSEYLRRCALRRVIMSRTDDMMVRELRRIAGLLKHVHIESGGAYSADTAAGLDSVRSAIDRIASASRAAGRGGGVS